MTRAIKFRIYDPEKKKFIESGSTPMMLALFFKQTARLCTALRQNYEEFTGLKDKNGKKIYEGDVVHWLHDKNPIVVKFDEGGYYAEFNDPNATAVGMLCGYIVEIIGNIHENKDLLK